MESTFKIIWTNRALADLKNIVTYLEENWTVKEIQKITLFDNRQNPKKLNKI